MTMQLSNALKTLGVNQEGKIEFNWIFKRIKPYFIKLVFKFSFCFLFFFFKIYQQNQMNNVRN